jgi:hypothetical protein
MSCLLAHLVAQAKRAAVPGLSLTCALLGVSAPAHAASVQWSTDQVDIQFDPDSFSFHREASPGYIEDISPASLTYSQVGQGVEIDFNNLLSLYATSYTYFSPQTLSGDFSAAFAITPRAGYVITGYTITFSGSYSIETPGSVYVGSTVAGPFTASTGSGAFNFREDVVGAVAPALTGSLGATGDVNIVQVFDGYQQVFDHYESVLDYCETQEPFTCYYRDEPVYIDVPMYHDETDLGEAQLSLQKITLLAHVTAVPESEAMAMAAGGLPVLAWWAKRRKALRAAAPCLT